MKRGPSGPASAVGFEVGEDVGFGQHDATARTAESDPPLLHQPAQQPRGEDGEGSLRLLEREVAAASRRLLALPASH
jgi:hypothetical protein